MCCNNQTKNTCEQEKHETRGCNNNYLIIIVLYILLAIILGSCLF